jgi:hypothetical protein
MRGGLGSFPPSGNGIIARRKIRKACSEAWMSRSFSKSSVARHEATEIFGKLHHGFVTIALKWTHCTGDLG